MEHKTWHPKWWAEDKHGTTWNSVKEALKRDWEQTKNDVRAGGRDLDQNVNDTLKQVAGKDVIPGPNQPNAPGGTPKSGAAWTEVEAPMRYGYGARQQYGSEHEDWNDKLEGTLKTEWENGKGATRRGWSDVKQHVRNGYERARP